METPSPNKPPLGWVLKSVYLVVIACFVILGLVGLVLPIIPGLVFLFLAVLLLSRVSSRVNRAVGNHAGFRGLQRRWQRMGLLNAGDRIKLGFWYCARAIISGIDSGMRLLQSRIAR